MTSKPKIGAILIARQGSSRLPGKALAEVSGAPIIGHILDRLFASHAISEVAVATSTNVEDRPIVEYVESRGVSVYAGHPDDVLDRLYHAAKRLNVDAVIEVGGDCPFIDPTLVQKGIDLFFESRADSVTNALVPPFTYPVGYDFILVTLAALERAWRQATLVSERHQPFQYLVNHPELFTMQTFAHCENLNRWRWTLDYPEDLTFVRAIFDRLLPVVPIFGLSEIRVLLEEEPELIMINAMHANPVTEATAWHTGSYVSEVHRDIWNLLQRARVEEDARNFSAASKTYGDITRLLGDLSARATHFERAALPAGARQGNAR